MSGPDVTAPKKPPDQHLQAVHERLVTRARAPRASAPGIFVRRYQYSAGQIPGWVVQRARTVEPTARPNVLRLSQLTLACPDDPAQLVKLDVYETRSPEAARELMVELLTGYQSLPRQVELSEDVGDADVIFPGDGTRIFARGNLVMLLVNAGARGRTVGDLARSLDDFLMAAPSRSTTSRVTPARTRRAPARAAPEGESDASAASPDPMTRFMASSGTLRQKADGSIAAQGSERLVESTFEPGAESWQSKGAAADDEGKSPGDKPRTPRRSRPRRKKS